MAYLSLEERPHRIAVRAEPTHPGHPRAPDDVPPLPRRSRTATPAGSSSGAGAGRTQWQAGDLARDAHRSIARRGTNPMADWARQTLRHGKERIRPPYYGCHWRLARQCSRRRTLAGKPAAAPWARIPRERLARRGTNPMASWEGARLPVEPLRPARNEPDGKLDRRDVARFHRLNFAERSQWQSGQGCPRLGIRRGRVAPRPDLGDNGTADDLPPEPSPDRSRRT